jgi:hypothetical protein
LKARVRGWFKAAENTSTKDHVFAWALRQPWLREAAGVEPAGKVEITIAAKPDALVPWCKAWPSAKSRVLVEQELKAREERGGSGHCCLRGWRCNGWDLQGERW